MHTTAANVWHRWFILCRFKHYAVIELQGSLLQPHTDRTGPIPCRVTHYMQHLANRRRGFSFHGTHVLHRCAAFEALVTYPGGLQVGGGINPTNAFKYLNAGASHVIVTSYIFSKGQLNRDRLQEMVRCSLYLPLDCPCAMKNF